MTEPAPERAWSLASRWAPAFAVGQHDSNDKTETYEIFRHPLGGRKDVFRWADADRKPVAGRPCLGFLKRLDEPDFLISGRSCQGDTLPVRRAAVRCMLNRLNLLTAGNDPHLAELFARAELKRPDCAAPSAPALSDWMTGNGNPCLRGAYDGHIAARHWF